MPNADFKLPISEFQEDSLINQLKGASSKNCQCEEVKEIKEDIKEIKALLNSSIILTGQSVFEFYKNLTNSDIEIYRK